jgi:chorismate mutase
MRVLESLFAVLAPSSLVSAGNSFAARISSAKVIQYRYLADWQQDQAALARSPGDLRTEIRPALIALGDDILVAITEYLASGDRY